MDKILISVTDNSPVNIAKTYSLLNKLKASEFPSLSIWDYRDSEASLQGNEDAINIIFYAIEAVVIILSLFSLITSMSTNILEQTKEIRCS